MAENDVDRPAVLQNIAAARTASGGWHKLIQEYRDLYAFQHYKQDKKAKRGETRFADPTYTNVVDTAVGYLLANNMDWRAYGWSPDAQEQKDSSKIEKYLNGVLMIASRREEYKLEQWNTFQFVRDGASVLYSVWDPKIAARAEGEVEVADEESEEGTRKVPALLESPLRVQVVDPITVSFLPGGPRRWLVSVRDEKLSVRTVEDRYQVKLKNYSSLVGSDRATTEVTVSDYWELVEVTGKSERPKAGEDGGLIFEDAMDEDGLEYQKPVMEDVYTWRKFQPWAASAKPTKVGVINAILVDNQFVRDVTFMWGYEDLPYTVGFFKPVSRTDSANWGHGIIQPLRTSVDLLSRAINRRTFQLDVYSELPLIAVAGPGQNIQIDPGLARIVKLGQGSDIRFPQWPGNPPDFEEHISYLRARVQQSGFSDATMGGNNAASGYALSLMGDQNSIRLEQSVRNLTLQWETWAEKALRLTKNFAGDNVIRVYGRTRGMAFADYVSGTNIDEFMVECRIQPEFPNEVARNHAFFVQTKDELPLSYRMEHYLHIEQPDDMEERKLMERLLQDPTMQQYAMIQQLRRRAENGDEAAGIMLELVKQSAMKDQGGRPTEPNAPPQMEGMPSATGELTPQEQGGMPAGQSEGDKLNTMINMSPQMGV